MIDLFIPLSDIEFEGDLAVNGTNGPGDLVYLDGQVGPLNISTSVPSWEVWNECESDKLPETVRVRVRLAL